MDYLRKKLLAWLLPLAAAMALCLLLIPAMERPLPPQVWSFEGICHEIVAGTTAGRQALVASLWHAPLPTLIGLPGTALCQRFIALPATHSTLFIAFAALAYLLLRATRRLFPLLLALPVWIILLLLLGNLPGIATDPQLAITLTAASAALLKLADWTASRRLYDLVKFSFTLALLALCGAPLAGLTLALTLLLPLLVLLHPVSRQRAQGLLILGLLPLLYVLLLWHLMSHLILSDALYSWRFLLHTPPIWHGWSTAPFTRPHLACGLLALLLLPIAAWQRDQRTALLAFGTLLLLLWLTLLHNYDLAWSATTGSATLMLTTLLTLIAAISHAWSRSAPSRRLGYRLATIVALALALTACRSPQPADTQPTLSSRELGELRTEIATYIKAQTPYGRLFVCGYQGLGLLYGNDDDLFVPNLDLHLDQLRQSYKRQQLFLLLPEPRRDAACESPVWRHRDIYRHGAPRALFAADWPGWRLYEIISAPSAAELEEWRR